MLLTSHKPSSLLFTFENFYHRRSPVKIMDLPLVIFLQFEHLLSLVLNPVLSFVSSRAT